MLGRYRLLEELSENGVGVLHLSRLDGPNGMRWAAVRCVHPHLASDPVYVRDFYDAVRASASIRHPNVEATLDVGETDGTLWVASEYLNGERAAHLVSRAEIAETGVAWDVACRIIGQAALGVDAIHAAHLQRGAPLELTHGRLTPRQLFVSYEGETKILEACVPRRVSGISSDVLPYMAPEQVWGEPTDRRADVFALGVVLWEMCAGRRLFLGDDDDATRALLDKHHVPRLETHVRGMPARVDEVIALALAEDPRHRYPTAIDLAHALDEALVGESLVVTDYDTGRYMKALFADRYAAREERLRRAADATEIFHRSTLPSSRPPPAALAPVSRRNSIPPPQLPPKRRIPSAPETIRDLESVHEAKTVEGISLENYLESNENPTAILSEKERKFLLAESTPERATTDESETAIHRGAQPSMEFIDSTEIQAVKGPTAHLELADIMDDEEPAPEAFFRTGENETNIGPAPMAAALPVPAAVVRQGGYRGRISSIPPPSSGALEQPPTVEINATPPPMSAVDAANYVNDPAHYASDGFFRAAPPRTSYPPPPPMPHAGQTYMIPPVKTKTELSTVMWLFVLACLAVCVALVFDVWSRSNNARANQVMESVPPAVASSPAALTTAPPPSGVVNASDLPMATTGVVPHTKGPKSPPTVHTVPHPHPRAPSPPVTHDVAPRPTPTPVAASGGTGLLTVICTPACDDVLDGNTSLGPSPVFKAQVKAGTHKITLKTNDPPASKVVSVTVPVDDTTVLKQQMAGD